MKKFNWKKLEETINKALVNIVMIMMFWGNIALLSFFSICLYSYIDSVNIVKGSIIITIIIFIMLIATNLIMIIESLIKDNAYTLDKSKYKFDYEDEHKIELTKL